MNKYLFLICFFCFFTFHTKVNAQEVKTSSDMHLKGKVWRIDTYRHVADSVQIKDNITVLYRKKQLLKHIQYIFSKDGLLQAENRFDNVDDVIHFSLIYTFDEKNRIAEITHATFGKFLAGMTKFQYDKEGNKIKALVYDQQDSLQNIISYTYDFSGNLIKESTHNMIHIKIKELIYQYDERGNCISTKNIKTRAQANNPYRELQKFDERNNLIYKSSYDRNDSLEWEYFARYDSQDSLYYEEAKDKNGIIFHRSELRYNKIHNRTSLKLYSNKDGKIQELYSHYKYDKLNRLYLEEIFLQGDKKPFMIKRYIYDNYHNWIFCIEEDKRTGRAIVNSRRISYY